MAGDQPAELKVLMVAEKTSIAHTLASVFGGKEVQRRSGLSPRSPVFEYEASFKGERARFKVTATQGHVYSMDFADELPFLGKQSAEELFTSSVVKVFDKDARLPEHLAAEGTGCHVLVLWLDCDREGENICFEVMTSVAPVLDKSRSFPGAYKERIFRANFSSLCKADLQKAMMYLGVPSEDEALSVDARMEIDLRLGIAFSRFQTHYFKKHLGSRMRDLIRSVTYGPCQMPTLWFCVHRHCQIQAFVPKPYWRLKVNLSVDGGSTEFPAEATCGQMWSKNEAQLLLRKVCAAEYARVSSVDKRQVPRQRPLPLNTVTMLQLASKLAGLSPGDAMHHAEQLYMKGFLSYPRTETTRYPSEFDARAAIEIFQAPDTPWATVARRLMADRTAPRVDGVDHGDHPPITPVQLASEAQCRDAAAWNLYQLVCNHFLATFAPDCIFMETEVKFDLGGASLSAKSSRRPPADFTWCDILSSDALTEQGPAELQHLQVGGKCLADDSEILEQATQPPSHLNESDLLGLMEKHGIGTDASMATHISNVLKRNYVKLDAKSRQLTPTGLGLALAHAYTLVDPGLVRPTVRAKIENACARVAKGQARKQEVVDQAVRVFRHKFQNFSRRIDRVPVMLAMAYAPEQDRGHVRNASLQWEFAMRETAAIKLEHFLMVRERQELADEEQAGSELRPGMLVRIDGLKSAPQLNGQLGTCDHLDAGTGRWHIHLPSGETKALKTDNLLGIVAAMLWPGLPVRVQGLKSAPQLNGQEGICRQWDSASGRWQVCLKSNEVKSLKLENLQEITEGDMAERAAADAKKELEALGLSGADRAEKSWEKSWWQQRQTWKDWEDETPRKHQDEAARDSESIEAGKGTEDPGSSCARDPQAAARIEAFCLHYAKGEIELADAILDACSEEDQLLLLSEAQKRSQGEKPDTEAAPSRADDACENEAPGKQPKVVTSPRSHARETWGSDRPAKRPKVVTPPGARASHASESTPSARDEWASGRRAKWRKGEKNWESGARKNWENWESESSGNWPKVVTPPRHGTEAWENQASVQRPRVEADSGSHDNDVRKSEKSSNCPKVIAPPGAHGSWEKEPTASPTVVLPPRSGQTWEHTQGKPNSGEPRPVAPPSHRGSWKDEPKTWTSESWERKPSSGQPTHVPPPSEWGSKKDEPQAWTSESWEQRPSSGQPTHVPPPSARGSRKDESQTWSSESWERNPSSGQPTYVPPPSGWGTKKDEPQTWTSESWESKPSSGQPTHVPPPSEWGSRKDEPQKWSSDSWERKPRSGRAWGSRKHEPQTWTSESWERKPSSGQPTHVPPPSAWGSRQDESQTWTSEPGEGRAATASSLPEGQADQAAARVRELERQLQEKDAMLREKDAMLREKDEKLHEPQQTWTSASWEGRQNSGQAPHMPPPPPPHWGSRKEEEPQTSTSGSWEGKPNFGQPTYVPPPPYWGSGKDESRVWTSESWQGKPNAGQPTQVPPPSAWGSRTDEPRQAWTSEAPPPHWGSRKDEPRQTWSSETPPPHWGSWKEEPRRDASEAKRPSNDDGCGSAWASSFPGAPGTNQVHGMKEGEATKAAPATGLPPQMRETTLAPPPGDLAPPPGDLAPPPGTWANGSHLQHPSFGADTSRAQPPWFTGQSAGHPAMVPPPQPAAAPAAAFQMPPPPAMVPPPQAAAAAAAAFQMPPPPPPPLLS